jgi:hypothetical protein
MTAVGFLIGSGACARPAISSDAFISSTEDSRCINLHRLSIEKPNESKCKEGAVQTPFDALHSSQLFGEIRLPNPCKRICNFIENHTLSAMCAARK